MFAKLYHLTNIPNDITSRMEPIWADRCQDIICEYVIDDAEKLDQELYQWLINNGAKDDEYVYILIKE